MSEVFSMDFIHDLTGSLFWITVLSIVLFTAGSIAIEVLTGKSRLLRPMGAGFKLLLFFASVQLFLHLGAAEHYPRFSRHINFSPGWSSSSPWSASACTCTETSSLSG